MGFLWFSSLNSNCANIHYDIRNQRIKIRKSIRSSKGIGGLIYSELYPRFLTVILIKISELKYIFY